MYYFPLSQGVPDLNMLSSCLQQLWAFAEEAATNQTEQIMGRYDVSYSSLYSGKLLLIFPSNVIRS